MSGFEGKTALVTGAGSGIGAAIARELAAFIWAIARMVTPNAQPAAAAGC